MRPGARASARAARAEGRLGERRKFKEKRKVPPVVCRERHRKAFFLLFRFLPGRRGDPRRSGTRPSAAGRGTRRGRRCLESDGGPVRAKEHRVAFTRGGHHQVGSAAHCQVVLEPNEASAGSSCPADAHTQLRSTNHFLH